MNWKYSNIETNRFMDLIDDVTNTKHIYNSHVNSIEEALDSGDVLLSECGKEAYLAMQHRASKERMSDNGNRIWVEDIMNILEENGVDPSKLQNEILMAMVDEKDYSEAVSLISENPDIVKNLKDFGLDEFRHEAYGFLLNNFSKDEYLDIADSLKKMDNCNELRLPDNERCDMMINSLSSLLYSMTDVYENAMANMSDNTYGVTHMTEYIKNNISDSIDDQTKITVDGQQLDDILNSYSDFLYGSVFGGNMNGYHEAAYPGIVENEVLSNLKDTLFLLPYNDAEKQKIENMYQSAMQYKKSVFIIPGVNNETMKLRDTLQNRTTFIDTTDKTVENYIVTNQGPEASWENLEPEIKEMMMDNPDLSFIGVSLKGKPESRNFINMDQMSAIAFVNAEQYHDSYSLFSEPTGEELEEFKSEPQEPAEEYEMVDGTHADDVEEQAPDMEPSDQREDMDHDYDEEDLGDMD